VIKPIKCTYTIIFLRSILCVIAGSTGSGKIAGSTGSGKTNLLVDLLKTEGRLDYNDAYICSSTLYQPANKHLKEYYEDMDNMLKYQTAQTVKTAHFLDADDEIVNPNT